MAPLYLQLPRERGIAVHAELALPMASDNRGWYANWVMLVDHANANGHVAFVQVGLIRRNQRLFVFTAHQRRDESSIEYEQLFSVPESERHHLFSIVESKHDARCYYGAQLVLDLPDPFGPGTKIYAQVGPEVSLEGDQLAGTIEEVTIAPPGVRQIAPAGRTACRYQNHGVTLVPLGHGAFAARGTFNRALPSRFLGDCAGI